MNTELLERDFGPKGRRRTRRASVLATVIVLGAFVYGCYRFGQAGGFAWEKWQVFTTFGVWKFLLGGLVTTFKIAIVDAAISIIVGIIVALGQVSSHAVMRYVAVCYAECFRSLPTLLLILFAYFGLPALGVDISRYWAVVLGSAAYNSAVLSNVFKAGIRSVNRGEIEAGLSVGLRPRQVMVRIIAPPAFQRMLPSTVAQLVVLLKDSSLGFFIGYEELLRRTQIIGAYSENFVQSYLVAGLIYLVVCLAVSRLSRMLEAKRRSRPLVHADQDPAGRSDAELIGEGLDR